MASNLSNGQRQSPLKKKLGPDEEKIRAKPLVGEIAESVSNDADQKAKPNDKN